MAAAYVGRRVQITETNNSVCTGIVKTADLNNKRLTLEKVVDDEGTPLRGIHHFFSNEIAASSHSPGKVLEDQQSVLEKLSVKIVEPTPEERKKQTSSQSQNVIKKGAGSLLHRHETPAHLKRLPQLSHTQFEAASRNISYGHEPDASSTSTKRAESFTPRYVRKQSYFDDDAEYASSIVQRDEATRGISLYTVIDKMDEEFHAAMEHMSSQSIIGVAFEGVDIGRHGELCWIQMASKENIVLFDMLALGVDAIQHPSGIGSILESPSVMKILHDSRTVSDLLFHLHGMKLVNVFDTQVASALNFSRVRFGDLPRWVDSLTTLLKTYLNIQVEDILFLRFREHTRKSDQQIWKVRPVDNPLLFDVLVQNVRYLRRLRLALLERYMEELTNGFDVYLSVLRDADEEAIREHQSKSHLMPRELADMMRRRNNQRAGYKERYGKHDEESGFVDNCLGIHDPKIVFSHDGMWHGKTPGYEDSAHFRAKEEAKRKIREQRHQERMRSRNQVLISDGDDSGVPSDTQDDLTKQQSPTRGTTELDDRTEALLNGCLRYDTPGPSQKHHTKYMVGIDEQVEKHWEDSDSDSDSVLPSLPKPEVTLNEHHAVKPSVEPAYNFLPAGYDLGGRASPADASGSSSDGKRVDYDEDLDSIPSLRRPKHVSVSLKPRAPAASPPPADLHRSAPTFTLPVTHPDTVPVIEPSSSDSHASPTTAHMHGVQAAEPTIKSLGRGVALFTTSKS